MKTSYLLVFSVFCLLFSNDSYAQNKAPLAENKTESPRSEKVLSKNESTTQKVDTFVTPSTTKDSFRTKYIKWRDERYSKKIKTGRALEEEKVRHTKNSQEKKASN